MLNLQNCRVCCTGCSIHFKYLEKITWIQLELYCRCRFQLPWCSIPGIGFIWRNNTFLGNDHFLGIGLLIHKPDFCKLWCWHFSYFMELIHFLTMYWFRPGPEWPMPICPNLQSGWQDKYAFEFQTDQFLALRDQLEQRKLILVEKQNPHERIGRKTNNKNWIFPKCCFFLLFSFSGLSFSVRSGIDFSLFFAANSPTFSVLLQ